MTITLNITADTAGDFFTQLAGLNNGFNGVGTVAFKPEVVADQIMPELTKEPVRRTRQTKEVEPATAVVVQPAVAVVEGNAVEGDAAKSTPASQPAAPVATGTGSTTSTTTSAPAPAAEKTEANPSSSATLDFDKDVAPVVLGYVKTKTKAWVVKILGEFGVERASELPAAQWPELINALNDAAGA